MMKRLLLAMMLALVVSPVTHRLLADGAFYANDIKYTTPTFYLPVKAWFSFPASFCFLRISMPMSLKLVRGISPGDDMVIQWVDSYGNQQVDYWSPYWEESINSTGESHTYNVVISHCNEQNPMWVPVPYSNPSSHYKMFTLKIRDDSFYSSGGQGSIEITSYMLNYANVSQWCPVYYIDDEGNWRFTRMYDTEWGSLPYGDVNGDNEISISDMNLIRDIIIKEQGYYFPADINEDGKVDIIDLKMSQERITNGVYNLDAYWYTGYTIEEGHSKVTVKRLHVNDLNGDDSVDVGDVTMLIDSVLHGNTSELYDVNGDGSADVADVIELIDAVLNGY